MSIAMPCSKRQKEQSTCVTKTKEKQYQLTFMDGMAQEKNKNTINQCGSTAKIKTTINFCEKQ